MIHNKIVETDSYILILLSKFLQLPLRGILKSSDIVHCSGSIFTNFGSSVKDRTISTCANDILTNGSLTSLTLAP